MWMHVKTEIDFDVIFSQSQSWMNLKHLILWWDYFINRIFKLEFTCVHVRVKTRNLEYNGRLRFDIFWPFRSLWTFYTLFQISIDNLKKPKVCANGTFSRLQIKNLCNHNALFRIKVWGKPWKVCFPLLNLINYKKLLLYDLPPQ